MLFNSVALAEIFQLEEGTDLDFCLALMVRDLVERRALCPFDSLFARLDLDDPEAGDQFLGFGERAVDNPDFAPAEADARTVRTRLQSLCVEQHARFDQF